MKSLSTWRALAAEGLGTALLVATIVGSGIMADRLTDDTAMALLGNSIPTGAMLIVLITILGPISGAHFNPAVTLVFALRRELRWVLAGGYALAQFGGGITGSFLAHLMFDLPLLQVATNAREGGGQWLSEAVATFGLVAAILGSLRSRPEAVPTVVGLYVGAAYWFTASTSFANPAVTMARTLTDTFSGIRPGDAAAFVVAQVTGATVAAVLVPWLLTLPDGRQTSDDHPDVAERPLGRGG